MGFNWLLFFLAHADWLAYLLDVGRLSKGERNPLVGYTEFGWRVASVRRKTLNPPGGR